VEQGGSVIKITRQKGLALLAYLAVTGQGQSRETLTALLWPEADKSHARAALRRVLADLKVEIGDAWLDTTGQTVALTAEPAGSWWSDVAAFRARLAERETHGHTAQEACAACATSLREAIALYRDDFLAGFTLPDSPAFDEWQFFETEKLRREFSLALERFIAYALSQKTCEIAVPFAQRWVALDPLLEPPQQVLMQLYDKTGQRAAAIRQYQNYVQRLEDELGTVPGKEITALYQTIRIETSQHPATSISRQAAQLAPGNLPQADTSFVGRERELAQIAQWMNTSATRLLTLVGLGGSGKTRLALQAATQTADRCADGTFFVPLEALTGADALIPAIADALRFSIFRGDDLKTGVWNYLSSKQLLLVIDNFEHLAASAGLLAEILSIAPAVKILVTSHEPLNLPGENVLRLGGLDFPGVESDGQPLEPEDWYGYSAIQLFVQSARRTPLDFKLTTGDWVCIARICQLVDGLPLGIQLAAGWVDTLSLQDIADELSRGLDILELDTQKLPERHRSLRAVFESSWKMLKEPERAALMQLAVFRGGFTRPAAQSIAGASLQTLRWLVTKSLLRPEADFRRYHIHSLLRQYTHEKLEAAGKAAAARRAHSVYFADFIRLREAVLKGRQWLTALKEIEADFENVRAAWLWAAEQRDALTINYILESLYIYCVTRNLWVEAEELVQNARDHFAPRPGETPLLVWGRLLTYFYGEAKDSQHRVQQGLEIARAHNDEATIAHCQAELGWLAIKDRHYAEAVASFNASLDFYLPAHENYYIINILRSLAFCYAAVGQEADAIRAIREGLALSREMGDQLRIAECLGMSGSLACFRGMYAEAIQSLQEAYELQRDMGNWADMTLSNLMLGWLNFLTGDFAQSRILAEEVLRVASSADMRETRGIALIELGLVACFDGDSQQARIFLEESQAILTAPDLKPWARALNPEILFLTAWGTAVIACELGDYAVARRWLQIAIRTEPAAHSPAALIWCHPIAAVLLAQAGDKIRAIELLALAFTHSTRVTGWLEKWPRLGELQAAAKAELGAETYEAVWARGMQRSPQEIIRLG
jgi:predicted ATPase/DNA-binding SARP family transcriptional activator